MASETKDLRRIRKGCTDKPMRALILAAIRTGARYRMTKNGILIYGPAGTANAHFTGSDYRAPENFRAQLNSIGITLERK